MTNCPTTHLTFTRSYKPLPRKVLDLFLEFTKTHQDVLLLKCRSGLITDSWGGLLSLHTHALLPYRARPFTPAPIVCQCSSSVVLGDAGRAVYS